MSFPKNSTGLTRARSGMTRTRTFALSSLLLLTTACGGSIGGKGALAPEKDSGLKSAGGTAVSKAAKADYDKALGEFVAHDKNQNWDDSSCKSVAGQFEDASEQQESDTGKALPEALYNAGLSFMRCGMDKEAISHYEAARKAGSNFHRARAQMVLFEFKKNKDLSGTISKLEQIIRDAKFQNVEALVSVAALQMERSGTERTSDGKNDLERAKKNIQRSLAIDDNFMPAFNQLAVYYMEQAKAKSGISRKHRRRGLAVAGAKRAKVNMQQLELAALVASQAIRKNAKYAPIHNTAGLIQVEMKKYNGAVKSFGKARRLDPKFFEAHMNYGAVNLTFRGFKEAEKAYRDAIKLSPNDYEAHLGLALAIRGQINDGNFTQFVAEAQKHLDECRRIAPERPEAYYNEAILTQEYKAKSGNEDQSVPMLKKAASIYRTFIQKASGDSVFAEAVKRSEDRSEDITDTVQFIEDGIQMRKQSEEIQKKQKASKK